MRSTTESGFGSTSRGALPLLLLDEPVQRALEQVHGQVLERHVLRRRQLARGAAEDQRLLGLAHAEPAPRALTRAYSCRRSASSWRSSSPSSSRASSDLRAVGQEAGAST